MEPMNHCLYTPIWVGKSAVSLGVMRWQGSYGGGGCLPSLRFILVGPMLGKDALMSGMPALVNRYKVS